MNTNRILRSGILALLWLSAAASARAENPLPIPDHVWVLGMDSHHPIGIAWDNPVRAGVHSSVQVFLCLGMQHPLELRLPMAVLGPLMLGGLVALTFGLLRWFRQHKTKAPFLLLPCLILLMVTTGCATCRSQSTAPASSSSAQQESRHPFWEWFADQAAKNLLNWAFCR